MKNKPHHIQIGEIKSIGKAWGYKKFPTLKVHYLTFADSGPDGEEGFSSVALELGIFAWSTSRENAKEELFLIIEDYLQDDRVTGTTIDTFLQRSDMDHLWTLYRRLIFLIGDPETKSHDHLVKTNENLRQHLADAHETNAELQVDLGILKERLDFHESKVEA